MSGGRPSSLPVAHDGVMGLISPPRHGTVARCPMSLVWQLLSESTSRPFSPGNAAEAAPGRHSAHAIAVRPLPIMPLVTAAEIRSAVYRGRPSRLRHPTWNERRDRLRATGRTDRPPFSAYL